LTILQTNGLFASSTTTLIGSDPDAEFALPLLSHDPNDPVDLIFASPPLPLELDENNAEINPEGDNFDSVEF